MGKERGLAPGKIEKVWVKRNPPPNAPPGSQPVMAPYQIQLDEGGFVFAPHDNDSTIRADPNATAFSGHVFPESKRKPLLGTLIRDGLLMCPTCPAGDMVA